MTAIISEGAEYNVFFRDDNRPVRDNPVRVTRCDKKFGKVHAMDSQNNQRVFALRDFVFCSVDSLTRT